MRLVIQSLMVQAQGNGHGGRQVEASIHPLEEFGYTLTQQRLQSQVFL